MTIWKRFAEVWCIEINVEIDKEKNANHLATVTERLKSSNTPPSALDAIFGAGDDDDDEF